MSFALEAKKQGLKWIGFLGKHDFFGDFWMAKICKNEVGILEDWGVLSLAMYRGMMANEEIPAIHICSWRTVALLLEFLSYAFIFKSTCQDSGMFVRGSLTIQAGWFGPVYSAGY